MKKPVTESGIRSFTCKRCGERATENIYRWRKKPQHLKNVCTKCLEKADLQHRSARERAKDIGYYF